MTEQTAYIYHNDDLAGFLTKTKSGYTFSYEEKYFLDKSKPAISLSFPKDKREYKSFYLFPFFFGLLSEGENKDLQCRILKLDDKDYFTRLIKTAGMDTIGSITVRDK
ncbi:MAG TPA: HipA N-terminal domain-containing protein [Ignavibacteria bacterium]|nr:HipA N-terminal domain-containing protein [Ignavibacteria bacterium]